MKKPASPKPATSKKSAKPTPAAAPVPAPPVTPPESVVKTTNGKAHKAKAPKPPKPISPWSSYVETGGKFPEARDLVLTGIVASERNRYVTMTFSNGFTLQLDPVSVRATADVLRLRKVVIEYFTRVLPVQPKAVR